jgi:hypothetical protein
MEAGQSSARKTPPGTVVPQLGWRPCARGLKPERGAGSAVTGGAKWNPKKTVLTSDRVLGQRIEAQILAVASVNPVRR